MLVVAISFPEGCSGDQAEIFWSDGTVTSVSIEGQKFNNIKHAYENVLEIEKTGANVI